MMNWIQTNSKLNIRFVRQSFTDFITVKIVLLKNYVIAANEDGLAFSC